MSSFCEQSIINSNGSVLIIGNCYNDINFNVIASDFLLNKMNINNRYKKLLCINFERDPFEIISVIKLYNNYNKTTTNNNDNLSDITLLDSGRNFDLTMKISSKVYIYNKFSIELNTCDEFLENLFKKISEEILALNSFESLGVFVYSVSELLLSIGFLKTIKFIKKLSQLISTSVDNDNNNNITLILPINQSLHSSSEINSLQQIASVVVVMIPNNQTLSSEVIYK